MAPLPANQSRDLRGDTSSRYFILANLGFVSASIIGVMAAIIIAFDADFLSWLAFEDLRPLHTFLSIIAVLGGIFGLLSVWINKPQWPTLSRIQWSAMVLFVGSGVIALSMGQATGREYFSWPLLISMPLLFALVLMLWQLLSNANSLKSRSPEGFWLIGFGCFFIFQGFVESQLWQTGWFQANFVQDLSIQWHGIDSFFAGINTVLYGGAVFLMSKKPKPLRKSLMFAIAGFSLLFTFGHHHYASPQPHFLKILAVLASMVAMLSFWRHLVAYKKIQETEYNKAYIKPLWRAVELWTIVSIASGVLFAIPQLNLVIHGTYLVVIHTMGSMIGVNMMIIVLGSLIYAARENVINSQRVIWGVRLVNGALLGLWLVLGSAGLIKGIMRTSNDYATVQSIREYALLGFPLIGFILFVGITLLCFESIRVNSRSWQRRAVSIVKTS